jgi:hypothetical protein
MDIKTMTQTDVLSLDVLALQFWSYIPADVLFHGCYVSGCFVPMEVLYAGRFVRPDVLSRRTFCPS